MAKNKLKNIAVIGAGAWGKNLVRVFHELGALGSVCDSNPKTLEIVKKSYPGIRTTLKVDEIFKDGSITAVVIAAPAAMHYRLAVEAIVHDKDVYVEKPLALQLEESKELVALGKKKKKVLMVGHILHYHNAVVKLKDLIKSGELGKIQYIYSNRLNIGTFRSEENILWSFAPHDISAILMLLDEWPDSLYTTGESYLQKNIMDVTMTTLSFKSGIKAHIFVSWLHPFKEQKLVVVGDKKMAVFDDVSEEKLFLYPHSVKWVGTLPVATKAASQIVSFKHEEPLKQECQHFLDCLHTRKEPQTNGEEGLKVLKILNASEESLRSKKIVTLDHDIVMTSGDYRAHETAVIDQGTKIGKGTQIWHFSHVLRGSQIGTNCTIGQNVMIGPDVSIGNNCKIQNNVSVYKGVTLEDNVFCGPSMVFTNVFNPRCGIPRMDELKETLVKKGATLGANATILCGITIGQYAFIGAGAVVTKDVPDYALVFGNPAKQNGWMCECGVKLDIHKGKKIQCQMCQKKYRLSKNILRSID